MNRQNRFSEIEETRIDPDAAQPLAPVLHSNTAKVSVPLEAVPYQDLLEFCASAARFTGSRVTHAQVLRLLLDRLHADEVLRGQVLAQLRADAEVQASRRTRR